MPRPLRSHRLKHSSARPKLTDEYPYLVFPATPREPQYRPSVSVCIPTKDRARTIEACLVSIRRQEYPSLELIVVDNESTDRTPEIAAKYADRLIRSPGPLGLVRQTSIDAANGEILAILDDDVVLPHPQWMLRAVQMFGQGRHISTVWPRLIEPPDASLITRAFFRLNDAIFADRMLKVRGVFGGGNSLFRRDAVVDVGGFDTEVDFGEDMVLAARLKAAGYSVAYSPDPLIHDSMYSLAEIYRKQKWGARAIRHGGWELMAQPATSLLREQFLVGGKAFLRGLLLKRDLSWIGYPVLLGAKALAYGAELRARPARHGGRR